MQIRNEPVRAREPFMEMQWKIGNVQIDNPFVLAPMAGVTKIFIQLSDKLFRHFPFKRKNFDVSQSVRDMPQ